MVTKELQGRRWESDKSGLERGEGPSQSGRRAVRDGRSCHRRFSTSVLSSWRFGGCRVMRSWCSSAGAGKGWGSWRGHFPSIASSWPTEAATLMEGKNGRRQGFGRVLHPANPPKLSLSRRFPLASWLAGSSAYGWVDLELLGRLSTQSLWCLLVCVSAGPLSSIRPSLEFKLHPIQQPSQPQRVAPRPVPPRVPLPQTCRRRARHHPWAFLRR